MSGILTPAQTHKILKELGHQPQKKLGQNFLIDKNIVHKSITLAALKPMDIVIEIGPGLGTLSSALLESGAIVYAIEKDPTLTNYLQKNLIPKFPNSFNLINADALDFPLANLPFENAQNFKIIANLPYAIATPWLESILNGPLPSGMTLMLQKEAADRLCASHNSKSFSAISIFLNSAYTKTAEHKVSANCFYPKPKVDSLLLHLEKNKKPFLFHPKTRELIRTLFTQRRKQIASLSKQIKTAYDLSPWLNHIESNNIPLSARPENIPIVIWQKLNELIFLQSS